MAITRCGVTRPGNRTRLTDCFSHFFHRCAIDEQLTWDQTLASSLAWQRNLPGDVRTQLEQCLDRIMSFKQELLDLALQAGSREVCRDCCGKCCLHGKYYVTPLDLLAYQRAGQQAVEPDFGRLPACPYGSISGCRMPPRFRPLTCVVFNCEAIEEQMEPAGRERAEQCEQGLREAIALVERCTGKRLNRAVLFGWDDGCNSKDY